MKNDLTVSCLASQIPLRADGKPPLMSQIPYLWYVRDEITYALGAVIDDKQFLIIVVLGEKKTHCVRDELPAIGGWHNAAGEGHRESSLASGDERTARNIRWVAKPDVLTRIPLYFSRNPRHSAWAGVPRPIRLAGAGSEPLELAPF
jgi:hypothetical protein